VGELAEATGLTVRTLHHYEHLGLLEAGARTEGRHRLYGTRDVRRLYQIRALRDLGLPLEEIGRVLGSERPSVGNVLRDHLARVDAELERLGRLRVLLAHASAHAGRIDDDSLLATIEAMSRVARRAEVRGRDSGETEARWRKLGDELRACMTAGEPPSARRPRAIARRARALLVEFAGGDERTLAALAHLRRVAPPEDLAGWDAPLMGYLDQALANLSNEETEQDE
jgi:MerR family transcriptional regulator, thiopeptide resistance regulator